MEDRVTIKEFEKGLLEANAEIKALWKVIEKLIKSKERYYD